jgi:hypothetical protein
MIQVFPKDENVNMNLEVPTFVNTRKNDYILSKKYTKEKEGLTMKRLNKKIETINNIILAVAIAGIIFWLLGDGLFGHLGGLIVTIIVTISISLLTVRKLQLKNKKLQLKLMKARR